MMKTLLLLIGGFILILNSFSQQQLTNFDDLMGALEKGKEVKAVFHYAKCQLISDNEIQDKIPDAMV